MRIATFNVNGINARLAALTLWLEESEPRVAGPRFGPRIERCFDQGWVDAVRALHPDERGD